MADSGLTNRSVADEEFRALTRIDTITDGFDPSLNNLVAEDADGHVTVETKFSKDLANAKLRAMSPKMVQTVLTDEDYVDDGVSESEVSVSVQMTKAKQDWNRVPEPFELHFGAADTENSSPDTRTIGDKKDSDGTPKDPRHSEGVPQKVSDANLTAARKQSDNPFDPRKTKDYSGMKKVLQKRSAGWKAVRIQVQKQVNKDKKQQIGDGGGISSRGLRINSMDPTDGSLTVNRELSTPITGDQGKAPHSPHPNAFGEVRSGMPQSDSRADLTMGKDDAKRTTVLVPPPKKTMREVITAMKDAKAAEEEATQAVVSFTRYRFEDFEIRETDPNTNVERSLTVYVGRPPQNVCIFVRAGVSLTALLIRCSTVLMAWNAFFVIYFVGMWPIIAKPQHDSAMKYLPYDAAAEFVIFILDVVMPHRISVVDTAKGLEYVELPKIKQIVRGSDWWKLNVLSMFGTLMWLSLVPDIGSQSTRRLLSMVGWLRLLRYRGLSIRRRGRAFSKMATPRTKAFTDAIELVVGLFFVLHVYACSWFAVVHSVDEATCFKLDPNDLPSNYYLTAFRDACLLFGGSPPDHMVDRRETPIRLLTCLLYPAGSLFGAMIFARVVLIEQRAMILRSRTLEKQALINAAMSQVRLPIGLQRRVNMYHQFMEVQHDRAASELLYATSSFALSLEIKIYLFSKLIELAPFFQDLNPAGVGDILDSFQEEIFSPGDYILRLGQEGKEMYFIMKGICDVLIPNPVFKQITSSAESAADGDESEDSRATITPEQNQTLDSSATKALQSQNSGSRDDDDEDEDDRNRTLRFNVTTASTVSKKPDLKKLSTRMSRMFQGLQGNQNQGMGHVYDEDDLNMHHNDASALANRPKMDSIGDSVRDGSPDLGQSLMTKQSTVTKTTSSSKSQSLMTRQNSRLTRVQASFGTRSISGGGTGMGKAAADLGKAATGFMKHNSMSMSSISNGESVDDTWGDEGDDDGPVGPKKIIVAAKRVGDYFGETALVQEGAKRTAYVRARTFMVTEKFSSDKFNSFIKLKDPVAYEQIRSRIAQFHNLPGSPIKKKSLAPKPAMASTDSSGD